MSKTNYCASYLGLRIFKSSRYKMNLPSFWYKYISLFVSSNYLPYIACLHGDAPLNLICRSATKNISGKLSIYWRDHYLSLRKSHCRYHYTLLESVRVWDSEKSHWISVNIAPLRKHSVVLYWLKSSEFSLDLGDSHWFIFKVTIPISVLSRLTPHFVEPCERPI